jgi:F420-dependent oxidoreductase-like protein
MVWRREPVVYDGQTVQIPLPPGQGTGLGKPLKLINRPKRADIPVFWASLMGKSVTNTARHATGWLPAFFDPERFETVWGEDLRAGLADRDPMLGPLQISAGGMVAIGDEFAGDGADHLLDLLRPGTALYLGGMGSRDRNFYFTIAKRYGYVDEATEVQDLYLSGRRDDAAAAVPRQLLASTNLIGPESYVAERIAAYEKAGVTHLSVTPGGPDPVKTIERLRGLLG